MNPSPAKLNATDPSAKPDLPLYVDSTMLSAFKQCPQKFYTEFVLGLRPVGLSIDLHAGACFASAMENTYRGIYQEGLTFEAAKLRAFGLYLDQWGDFPMPAKDTPKNRERVWEAVEEYFRQWPPASDPVQPFHLAGAPSYEFTFGIPLSGEGWPRHPSGSPFIYSGRFDMLGTWGPKLVVRDEKTTTSIGAAWADQWDLRSQFMGYVWACQQSGLTIDTVCVRGIGILKTKISLAEAFKTFPSFKVERWLEQIRRDLWRLRRCWDEGYWDYNFADACSAYGGCAFRDLCGSLDPEPWRSQYVVRRWNPIQKNPIAEENAA